MNTNTIQVIITTVTSALIGGIGGMEVTDNILTGAAVGVSYFAVFALIAMAASDYRSGPKAYFTSSVVTGHFQREVPASVSLRTPSEKARMAA